MKIVDSYGNELGYQQGDDYVIKDRSGNRLGWINALNDIINTYGTKVGELRSDGVYDVYGSRIGDVDGDNIISLLIASLRRRPSYTPSHSSDSDGGGWLAIIAMILMGAWAILKRIFFLFAWHFGDGGFDFKGTSTRSEWWKKTLLGLLAVFLCFLIVGGITYGFFSRLVIVQLIILFVPTLFSIVPLIAVSVRRVHDIGKSGWFVLIPIFNFILCGFVPGKVDGNKYK